MILKVCGMKDQDNIDGLATLKPDWIGLIFYAKSPRNVQDRLKLNNLLAKRIGVFVNAPEKYIKEKIGLFSLNGVQLHGDESPELCASLRTKHLIVIKSFAIAADFDFVVTKNYEDVCDYFLFDTKVGSKSGGTGKQFDWSILDNYTGNTPFLLSGGIAPESVKCLKEFFHEKWAGIDINSRFEISPGYKDIEKIKKFKHELFS